MTQWSDTKISLRRKYVFLMVVGILVVAMNLRPSITSVGPLIGYIQQDYGLSSGVAGFLTTLPLLGFAVMSAMAPRVSNRLGLEWTIFLGLVILGSGIFIRSIPWLAALFAGTAMLGIGIAIGNVLLPGFIKEHFPAKIGLMTSLYTTTMNTFAATASGLSVPLARGLDLGWRLALLCWGMLAVIGLIVWLPQVLARRQKDTRRALAMSGQLWRAPLAWQVTLFMGLQSFSFYVTITWLPEILQSYGWSASLSGWILSLVQFLSLPATFLAPVLADRMRHQRWIVLGISCFYFIGFGGLLYGGSLGFILLWAFCIGCAQGASISLSLAFLGLRAKNAREAAELSGMAQSFGYLLAAIGPILIGFLFDWTSSWTLPITVLLATGIIMTIAGLGAGRDKYVTNAT